MRRLPLLLLCLPAFAALAETEKYSQCDQLSLEPLWDLSKDTVITSIKGVPNAQQAGHLLQKPSAAMSAAEVAAAKAYLQSQQASQSRGQIVAANKAATYDAPVGQPMSTPMPSPTPPPLTTLPAENTEKYGHYATNPVIRSADQAVSTFSIDVDTGSYANVRRYLLQNKQLPRRMPCALRK